MKEFQFSLHQNSIFGIGSLDRLPQLLSQKGIRKAFLVSDRSLEKLGAVGKVRSVLTAAGIETAEFLDVVPNPTVAVVEQAAAAYKTSGCAAMIALGGGSPMDTAKAAGLLAKFGGRITDYEGSGKVPGKIDPLIAIPTTAGTGSEVTFSAVVTDPERDYKFPVISPNIAAEYAILDPQFIMSAPASVAASCGVDALTHAIEAYISKAANPFTDAMAEKAISLIGANLRRYTADRTDPAAAGNMMLGSNFAGIAFAGAKLGDIHAMSHPVSAVFHVPHGVANAILMPTVLEFNALADEGRYEKILSLMIGRPVEQPFDPQQLPQAIRQLNAELGIPASLKAVGVSEEKIPQMAEDAMKSGNIAVNPRQTAKSDVIAMYHQAMQAGK